MKRALWHVQGSVSSEPRRRHPAAIQQEADPARVPELARCAHTDTCYLLVSSIFSAETVTSAAAREFMMVSIPHIIVGVLVS